MPIYRDADGNINEKNNFEFEWSQQLPPLCDETWTRPVLAHETVGVLLNHGADPHAIADDDNPPLHIAAIYNAYETAEMLLNQGADINAKNHQSQTPLHIAVSNNACETAEMLLNQGIDVNIKDNHGQTLLHIAVSNNACETAEMLLNQGIDVNIKENYGNTPLHIAAIYNACETAEMLLNQGADINAKNNQGQTPLHIAARKGVNSTPYQAEKERVEMSEADHRLALPQGTRIRDYGFQRVLGQGGFGITYLCWNMALDVPVAIKEYMPYDLAIRQNDLSVVPQSSQAAFDFGWGLDRFSDEFKILSHFNHPNIVRVHQFFEAHNTAYIVMEYVEGETLSSLLERKGTLGYSELTGILYPLLDVLEEVHGAGFLHRNVNPGNIIIRDEDNSPVLLDFGEAVSIKNPSAEEGVIIAPHYAPIEQYSMRGEDLGPWTDIYALGAVCYQVLTGQRPIESPERVRHDSLIRVAGYCAGAMNPDFLSAIDWALQVYKEDRPQSIAEWRRALNTVRGVT